jgi:hypothetical protein
MPKQILSGRPGHTSSPENMKVDVEDILSRISGRVEDDAVSTVLDSLFLGDLPRFEHYVSDQVFFIFGDVIQGREVLLRNE